ncbi:hypothetical protein [Frankia tisae]|uniref:hypothetical protein n=1 Tax=Frankia tisae TaxID=2950104 RepID=UPI0021C0F0B9|nr:hypothetical protein [Frankia tisae]
MTKTETQPWVLDGCAILNLAAALPLDQLSVMMRRPILAVQQAAAEALYLHDTVDGVLARTPIDVQALEIASLSSSELDDFVALASSLDDGEAATLALAHGRSYVAVTDDKAARKAALRLIPQVAVIGTASAVRYYVETNGVLAGETRKFLAAIERRAHFYPPSDDPERFWWTQYRNSAQ